MTVGTSTYMGLALPLRGEAEIVQTTLGTDILTITGAASQSGDFLVCRLAAGTEKFAVDVSGNVVAAGYVQSGSYFQTGLVAGTAALDTVTLPASGCFGFAVVSSTSRLYVRQGTAVTYFNAAG